MITVNTTKTAKESVNDGNVTINSSNKSLLDAFVNENRNYSIETLKAGTYDAIFSKITFGNGVPVFKVFDRFNNGDDDFYEDDVYHIKLTVSKDIPAVKGRNNFGTEEYWVPFNGGWAWVDPIPQAYKVKELSKKLSKEAQEELKYAKSYSRQFGSQAESVVLKTLLDFERTITNGRYFNGNSIVSDKALINKAFKELSQDAAHDYEDEYPGLTMTMTGVEAIYNLNELDPESYTDYLLLRFDVDCKDSNGKSFKSMLTGQSNIYYPDPHAFFDYRAFYGEDY